MGSHAGIQMSSCMSSASDTGWRASTMQQRPCWVMISNDTGTAAAEMKSKG